MKKFLLSIFCFMLTAVSINAQEVAYTLTPKAGSNNSYAGNCDIEIDGIKWNLTGNSTMIPWRMGGKSLTKVDRALYSKTPMDYAVDKVVLSLGKMSSITVNSAKLLVADNADFTNATETSFTAKASTDVEIPVNAAAGSYYKFVFNVTVSVASNKFIEISKAVFYKAAGSAAVTAKPTFSPSSCTFEESLEVTISAEEGATIYYTVDGTEPTTESNEYAEALTIEETTTVKAIAVLNDVASSVATAEYTKLEAKTIAEVIEAGAGTAYTTGTVVATYNSGFLMSDETGSILVYQGKANIGDVVKVKGTTSKYAGLLQFGAGSTVENTGTTEVTYPEATVMDGAAMDAYLAAPYIKYVEYTGVLTISNNYYNVAIEGATKAQGSISYPATGLVTAKSGETVKVTGYTIGVSSSKYVNTMAVKVEKIEPLVPTSVVRTNKAVEYQLKGVQIMFDEVVTATAPENGEYGYVLNANGEKVFTFDKMSGGTGVGKFASFSNSDYSAVIETPGEYKVVITTVITGESGKVYKGGEYAFTVTKHPVEVERSVEFWGTVKTLPLNIDITINYADVIELDKTKKVTYITGETTYEAVVTKVENVISIAFDENVEYAEGDYTFNVPAGLYTADGEANEAIAEEFTYKKPVPLKVLEIQPAEGEVESISTITILFNQAIEPNYMFEMSNRMFMRTNGWEASAVVEYTACNGNGEPSPITEAGEYVFDVTFVTDFLAEGEKTTYTWTIAAPVEPEPDPEGVKVYHITAKDAARGALYATAESTHLTHCGATYGNYHNKDVAVNTEDINQQFVFVEYEGKTYLYSFGAKKFAVKENQYIKLVENPEGFVTVEDADAEGYKIIFFNGQNRLNFSGGYDHGCVANYETPDDGNRLALTEVGQYDATELLASIEAYFKAEAEALAAARAAFDAKYAEAETILAEANLSVVESELPLQVADANAAAYVWCNNPDPGEGPIAQLVDGIIEDGNFFHSSWRGGGEEPHYIEVDLGEGNELADFSFKYTTRFAVANDYPDGIQVLGSNDKEAYTELYNVTSGLPQTGGTEWTSNIVSSETAYRYLRFVVTAERTYWHMSEFDIVTSEITVAEKYAAVANSVVALDNAFKAAAENADYTVEELNAAAAAIIAAIEAINAGIATPELEALELASYEKNPNNNAKKLQGVKLNFNEAVKKYTTETTGDYGYIRDAQGNEVAKLTKVMGANGTATYATPYATPAIEMGGTYTVVVNSGVFLSADETKEYKGGEFEFVVEATEPYFYPSAEEGFCYNETFERVEDFKEFTITVKYAKEVILDAEKKVTMTCGENVYEAVVTLEEVNAITKEIKIAFDGEFAEGRYTINVPAGLFTIDGVANEEFAQSTFRYALPQLEITRDFDTWESYLDQVWYMPTAAMITIANAESVVVDETKVATIAVGENVYNSTLNWYYDEWSNAYYIEYVFEDFFAEGFEFVKGDYTFTLPAGAYTVNGVANEEAVKTYTYGDPIVEEFTVTEVLPAPGSVLESIDAISITFSNGMAADYLPVTCGDKTYYFVSMRGIYVPVDMTTYEPIVITEPGTYTLDLSELEGLTGEKVFSWTIKAAETVVDYTPTYTGNVERYDRNVTAVTLNDNRFDLLTNDQSMCYVDATETVTFTVTAGALLKANVEHKGEWLHHSVYIDVEGDGFTSGIEEGSEWKPAGDLVAYSFYNNGGSSDEYGYNSVGTSMSDMDRHMPEIPEFTAPTEPGLYRMRFVQDWCSIDPNGDSDGKFGDFMGNGGQIIDVMLEVVESAPELPALEITGYTPAEPVEKLETITITFSDEIEGTFDVMGMTQIYLGAKSNGCSFAVEGNVLTITPFNAITTPGEYALVIPEGLITRKANGEDIVLNGEITFTVVEPTGIEGVDAEVEQTIYDLTGRKIETITKPGIYIVGGRKVLVK